MTLNNNQPLKDLISTEDINWMYDNATNIKTIKIVYFEFSILHHLGVTLTSGFYSNVHVTNKERDELNRLYLLLSELLELEPTQII